MMTAKSDKDTKFSRSGTGEILSKDDPLFEALGSIDELNAHIGFLISESTSPDDRKILTAIQKKLSEIMSDLAFAKKKNNEDAVVSKTQPVSDKQEAQSSDVDVAGHFSGGNDLIEEIERLKKLAGRIQTFIQPGSDKTSSLIHIARTVCRRAERRAVSMEKSYIISDEALSYLNKLSEYFFYLSCISKKNKK